MKSGWFTAWAMVALGLGSAWQAGATSGSSSCQTPDSGTPITSCYFDLTAPSSTTQTPASAVLNGGLFRVPGTSSDLGQGFIVGTGVFQPFLRIQEPANGAGDGVESGFNTDANARLLDNHDRGGTNWNHSLLLRDLPVVTVCDGGGSTGTGCRQYYEFLLDINEQGTARRSGLSLDEFKLYVASAGDLTANSASGQCAPDSSNGGSFSLCGGTKVYDMDQIPGGDASLLLDYRNYSGSGNGVDLQTLIPVENFANSTQGSYVYLYSKFGATGDQCAPGSAQCQTPGGPLATAAGELNYGAEAGFEEWSVRRGRVALPSSMAILLLGMVAFAARRRNTPPAS